MMSKKQYFLLAVLVVISGLIGGGLSNWLFLEKSAFATKTAQSENFIVTEELRIVDKSGRERLTLGLNTKGNPRIVIWNINNNRSSMTLGMDKEGNPGLTFWDKNGIGRASFSLSAEGDPKIRLIDKNGKITRTTLGISPEGNPELFLFDKNGNKRAGFYMANEETSLGFMDKNGRANFGVGILTNDLSGSSETPMLYLQDKGEKSYWAWRLATRTILAANSNGIKEKILESSF